jgi:hypothetical protein
MLRTECPGQAQKFQDEELPVSVGSKFSSQAERKKELSDRGIRVLHYKKSKKLICDSCNLMYHKFDRSPI